MRRLYCVRHGESEQNIGGITGNDSPLTPKGIEQAKFIAARATKLPIEAIICSPLARAKQTAEYIAEATGAKIVETSELLIERKHPSHTVGLRADDEEQLRVEKLINDNFGEEGYRVSDEDTFEDLRARAIKALEYLNARPEKELLVVSHAIFLRILMGVAIFGPDMSSRVGKDIFFGFKSANTGLTVFERDEDSTFNTNWRVLTWNDHAHLG